MFKWLQSLNFYKKRHEEIRIRIEFLTELEKVWTRAWDYRLGQLIEDLVSYENDQFYSEKSIKMMHTEDWLELIESIGQRFSSGHYEVNSQSSRTPLRIPIAMRRLRDEWIYSRLSFGAYLLKRLKEERPGGTLYGYDFSDEVQKVS
ncbi:hypothetical protein EHV15_34565 [Paenibacillus oralis]|uniref:Uncharacterized protein n=1 Tax=Paenibacillus oralis TaxID=2490856 RepID=A0A3P3TE59_9BACL|nr:hypothetical protein [Paenibacillus oralis]RRJ54723.1 hypothetical protein EHV15_34565 [Paenibacillus oralis]